MMIVRQDLGTKNAFKSICFIDKYKPKAVERGKMKLKNSQAPTIIERDQKVKPHTRKEKITAITAAKRRMRVFL